ncbi:MAG: universal stress protein [Armatimonadota bacterium]
MYSNILVPLDGSELAEGALPHARALAHAFQASISLISIVEPVTLYPQPGLVGPVISVAMNIDDEIDNASKYLQNHKEHLEDEGLTVHTKVLNGDPASLICDYAHEHESDLIVMSTHGRSGIKRWVYGSVADRVLRGARIPILLIRAKESSQ